MLQKNIESKTDTHVLMLVFWRFVCLLACFNIIFIFLFLCSLVFCLHVCLCTTCMQCSQRPERASHSLELEWQMIVNFCAGRWTCSQPLNHPPIKRCSSTEVCPRCAHVYTTSLCSSVHNPIIHVLCLFLQRKKYLRKLILGPRHLCLFLFFETGSTL